MSNRNATGQTKAIKVVLMHEKHALSRKIGRAASSARFLCGLREAWTWGAKHCKLQTVWNPYYGFHTLESSLVNGLVNGYIEIHTVDPTWPNRPRDCLIGVWSNFTYWAWLYYETNSSDSSWRLTVETHSRDCLLSRAIHHSGNPHSCLFASDGFTMVSTPLNYKTY